MKGFLRSKPILTLVVFIIVAVTGVLPLVGSLVHITPVFAAGNWTSQTSGTTQALNGVSCPTSSTCFAVGANGTIVATTNGGTTWTSQSSNFTQALNGISCPSTSACFAVGASGTIL